MLAAAQAAAQRVVADLMEPLSSRQRARLEHALGDLEAVLDAEPVPGRRGHVR